MQEDTRQEELSRLQTIELNPGSVVGKLIQHCWNVDGEDKWYHGKIIDLDDEEKTVQYTVQYNNGGQEEDDDMYSLTVTELLSDIQSGDLEILD